MGRTLWICLAAWFVPGAGHLMLRKSGRALAFFLSVMTLFVCGLAMEGRLFGFSLEFFGILKFLAGAGAGLPYLAAKLVGWGGGDVAGYGFEYGNTFLFTTGLLNMLVVVDAYDIAQGRKQ